MRSIFVLALKDLMIIRRDYVGLFFMIGFPVIMAIFFGLIGTTMSGEGSSAKMTIAVIDRDQSDQSRQYIQSLIDTDSIEQATLPDSLETDEARMAHAADLVRRGQLLAFITLPKGFGETAGIMWLEAPVIEVGIDPSRGAESAMLEGMLMQAMGDLVAARFADPGSLMPAIDDVRDQIAQSEDIPVAQRLALTTLMGSLDDLMFSLEEVNSATTDSPDAQDNMPSMQLVEVNRVDVTRPRKNDVTDNIRSAWDLSFPSAMLWGMLGSSAIFAVSIVRERKQGTFLRLQVAPISRAHILGGKALACFIAAIVVNILMIGLALALGMRPRDAVMLGVAVVCVAICFVGIMMLMSVIGNTEESVSGAAWGANVMMAMFGGGMVPLAFMPAFMKSISNFSPVKWGVYALEGAIWRGFSWGEIALPLTILVSVGAAGFVAGWIILRRKSA